MVEITDHDSWLIMLDWLDDCGFDIQPYRVVRRATVRVSYNYGNGDGYSYGNDDGYSYGYGNGDGTGRTYRNGNGNGDGKGDCYNYGH